MLVEDIIEREKIIAEIIVDFDRHGITNFGEWLTHYDSTLDQVEQFVNEYVELVSTGKFDEIERFQKVIMMNALALYFVELDVRVFELSDEVINKLLKDYVRIIRLYNRMLKGELKLEGQVFIYNITLHKFVDVEHETTKQQEANNHKQTS